MSDDKYQEMLIREQKALENAARNLARELATPWHISEAIDARKARDRILAQINERRNRNKSQIIENLQEEKLKLEIELLKKNLKR